MRGRLLWTCSALLLVPICLPAAQEFDRAKLKTAQVLWVADAPQLVYDVRFTGADTMPTALKILLKDIAESEGWYLTGKDKSTTVSSQSKRISIEYVPLKSKLKPVRIGKVEIKESPAAVDCLVVFSKKPSNADLTRLDDVLETFARKYRKAAKSVSSTVKHKEGSQPSVWAFEVKFKEPAKAAK